MNFYFYFERFYGAMEDRGLESRRDRETRLTKGVFFGGLASTLIIFTVYLASSGYLISCFYVLLASLIVATVGRAMALFALCDYESKL